MIKYEWRTGLNPAEAGQLADLLTRATDYDAEPEYNTVSFGDVERSMATADERTRHLLIWMLPYGTAVGELERAERVAGVIRVVADGDTAEATIVVDPQLRSIGIITLLLERMGLHDADPTGLWGGDVETITAWARGNHPAAGRLSNRFLIPDTHRVWKLICPVDPDEGDGRAALEPISVALMPNWVTITGAGRLMALCDDASVVAVAKIDLRPVVIEEFGRCATLTSVSVREGTDATEMATRRRQLLRGAMGSASKAGLTGVIMHVSSDDPEWVNACRSTGFQHARTDVRFHLRRRW